LAVEYGTLIPSNDSLHLVKSGKVCVFSGIYVVTQKVDVGAYGMSHLSFKPVCDTDISIVVANSSIQSVGGGYIDVNGDVYYQVTSPIEAGTQLRVNGTFVTN
jgi:hypothetical protein